MPQSPAIHRCLRPEDLRLLRGLRLAPGRQVDGLYAGHHAAARRGRSAEFADYRPFALGDNPADIDWRAFARSDRLFVKLFEHHSDMTVSLVIDASASMGYEDQPSGHASAWEHASRIAAAIAFLTITQRDQVGLSIAMHDKPGAALEPGNSPQHLTRVLDALDAVQPLGSGALPAAIERMIAVTPRGGPLIVLSDFLDPVQPVLDAVARHTHRGGHAVFFHVLHPNVLQLPNLGPARWTDSESADTVTADTRTVGPAYQTAIQRLTRGLSETCLCRRIDYNLASTATPYHEALRPYLAAHAATA